jgi:hypothetical protein
VFEFVAVAFRRAVLIKGDILMSVQLEIRDGNPWWLSPDLWTVPGDDPEGSPGSPIVGAPTYMWAAVRNTGSSPVDNATVHFYWANPSVGFDRSTANPIGTAFVSLGPGQAQDVLCLTPWVPAFVNGGHECVLAEAFSASDPLPAGPDFNVPTDRHVAQRNLEVLMASTKRFSARFEIHNASRKARAFRLGIQEGTLQELKPLIPLYGALLHKLEPGRVGNLHLTNALCPCEEEPPEERTLDHEPIKLAGGARTGLTLTGDIRGGAAIVHIRQFDERREVGGLSILVIHR